MHEQEPDPPTAETIPPASPRIYVASLSDYNAGRLHGAWLDAAQPLEDLQSEVEAMLARSPEPGAEEYAIHDFEGFGTFHPGEYTPLGLVNHVATGIIESGLAFAAWAAHCEDSDNDFSRFEEAYRGEWPSVAAYAEEFLEDVGATEALAQVPEWLQPYVELNVDGFARDLELSGDIWSAPSEGSSVYIFDGTL